MVINIKHNGGMGGPFKGSLYHCRNVKKKVPHPTTKKPIYQAAEDISAGLLDIFKQNETVLMKRVSTIGETLRHLTYT